MNIKCLIMLITLFNDLNKNDKIYKLFTAIDKASEVIKL